MALLAWGDVNDGGGGCAVIPAHELRRLSEVASAERPMEALIALRLRGYPLQYLEGTTAFGPLTLTVDGRTLIPRPETEFLADLLAKRFVSPSLVVDLCTGSGAVALFLKEAWPQSRVVGTDLSGDALVVAKLNGARLGIEVEWLQGDLFDALPIEAWGKVNLIVANPPYVSEREWSQLPIDVKHEPRPALVAGLEGTEVIDRLVGSARDWLAPGGEAWVEIGETQGAYLRDRHSVSLFCDQYGKDRFAMVKK